MQRVHRGDIWWVDFSGTVGGEVQKTRPAVIVSNNASNANANRVQVIPLSTQIGKLYPCEALVTVKGSPSKAMADQISTVSKQRLTVYLDQVSGDEMRGVELALKIQLGL
jgi:mRNA interferase MazF